MALTGNTNPVDASGAHAQPPGEAVIHPLYVRITHWINALALSIMVLSGWQIYNASPLFAFTFPGSITLGRWLAGALLLHFAAMWVLIGNGLVYLVFGLATGRGNCHENCTRQECAPKPLHYDSGRLIA